MNSDVAVLKAGFIPEGRTYRACLMFCRRMKIKFPGKKAFKESVEINKRFNKEG